MQKSEIKVYLDDELNQKTIFKLNKSLQNYLKVSVANIENNLTEYDRFQITDTTIIKYPNQGGYLLQQWNFKGNHKISRGKITNFKKYSISTTPTG